MELNDPPAEGVLATALEPFRGSSDERPRHVAVELLIRLGYITFETDTYPKREVPQGWIDDHKKIPLNTDAETDRHVQFKIHGARYLRGMGHDVKTKPMPNPKSHHISVFSCFEERLPQFTADVLCACEDCQTVVEAGYTPPERLLSAFGYSFGLDEERCLEQDSNNPICARIRDRTLDGFYTIPYQTGGSSVKVYKFEPTGEMPDADMGALRKSAGSILDSSLDDETP